MSRYIQSQFGKGEVAPYVQGRVDIGMYQQALARARNMIVHVTGGISKRAGLIYEGNVADYALPPRLVKFQFKTSDTYILEFGHQYMRVIRNGAHVLNLQAPPLGGRTITNITQTNPPSITMSAAHGFTTGEEVYLSEIVGMTELNGRRGLAIVNTPTTFWLEDLSGQPIDARNYTAYVSGGRADLIYEIATPYDQTDLMELVFAQTADVMTITHRDYNTQELIRFDHDDWQLSDLDLGPSLTWPTNEQVTVGTAGAVTDKYRVTAISEATGEESLPGLDSVASTIIGASQTNPVVLQITAHPYQDGDEVYVQNVVGMTEINDRRFIVRNPNANDFELENVDGTAYTAYVSGGTANLTFTRITNGALVRNNTVTWDAVVGAERYAVYRYKSGVYGLIGETEGLEFLDDNIDPDTSLSHPRLRDPFDGVNNQPACVGFFQQRRVFGSTNNLPSTWFASQTGAFSNFNIAIPSVPSDSMTVTLASGEVNEIRHFLPIKDLIIFTASNPWQVTFGEDSGFSIDTLKQFPQGKWGCSYLPPILVNNVALFLDPSDTVVRSLGYAMTLESYVGAPMNILSQHFFDMAKVVDWTYSDRPESRLFMVLDDGTMLTMTYEPDQEVVAFTQWDTDGEFERVEALPGDTTQREDDVYVVVKRTINGFVKRYIEIFRQDYFEEIEDAIMLDSCVSYEVVEPILNVSAVDPVKVRVATGTFANDDTVDIYGIEWNPTVDKYYNETQPDGQLNGGRYVLKNGVTAGGFDTFELYEEDGTTTVDGTAWTNLYVQGGFMFLVVSSITGYWHLEGKEVVALVNGNVETHTVTDGKITFDNPGSRIHVGLRYIGDLETLDHDVSAAPGSGTAQGRPTKIPEVTLRVQRSRGFYIGRDFSRMTEIQQRDAELWGDPTFLYTGDIHQHLPPAWKSNGRFAVRMPDPVPCHITALIPEFKLGENNDDD